MMQLILTFGLILVIGTLVLIAWGPDNKSVSRPDALAGSVRVFGQPFPSYYLLVLVLAPLVAVGLWLIFYRTRWGMLIRAATVDREMLGALGIDVSALYTQVFVFGSWLASGRQRGVFIHSESGRPKRLSAEERAAFEPYVVRG